MTLRAQVAALFVLGGLWAGLMVWVLVATPEPQRVPLTYVTGQTASRESGRGKAETTGLKIRIDLLETGRRQAEAAFVAPKNIFSPLRLEEPDGKGAAARRIPSPPPPPSAVPAGPSPEELAARAAQAELGQFRYLGYLSRQGREEGFLSKGKELHIVRVGDTIEQRVLVKAVTPTAVTLQETRSQVEKSVALAGEGK